MFVVTLSVVLKCILLYIFLLGNLSVLFQVLRQFHHLKIFFYILLQIWQCVCFRDFGRQSIYLDTV